jgi:hypothetical protein
MSENKTIRIDGIDYLLNSIPQEALSAIEIVNIAQVEISRLEALYKMAKAAHDSAIKTIADFKGLYEEAPTEETQETEK